MRGVFRAAADKRGLMAYCALLLCISCSGDAGVIGTSSERRAVWILAAPHIGIGQVSVVERVVVTPPHFWPQPLTAPHSLPGLSLLDTAQSPPEESHDRWIHRSQARLRADEIGTFEWPASRVKIEGPDGASDSLALSEFSIVVKSILPEFAGRSAPFGLRQPEALRAGEPGGRHWWIALLIAAGGVAAIALVRFGAETSRRGRAVRAQRPAPSLPWRTAHTAIALAAEVGERDPLAAAHGLSPALRRYMAARYGADTRGRTCEELRSTQPAFAMRSSWPPFAALVGELDELRFQAEESVRETAAARLPFWLEAATRCVDKTIPPEHRE